MSGASKGSVGLRERLTAPAVGALMVLCCLGAPLLVGAIGAVTLGAILGGVAVFLAAIGACLLALRLLRPTRGGC